MDGTRVSLRRAAVLLAVAVVSSAFAPNSAEAGGYDTPMLYSARHMGMGGTAVGYVNGATSLYHNPAGLGQVQGLHLLADLSLLVGNLQASPMPEATNTQSETTFSPAFLIGGALRLHDRVVVGLGAFPVAAAGGEYRYVDSSGRNTVDRTNLTFIELTPAVAVNFDEIGLRLGASYRITFVQLERVRTNGVDLMRPQRSLALDATGWDFAGFRVGVQYQPPAHPNLQLGLNYRHKTTTTVESNGDTYVSNLRITETVSTRFILPSRLAFGARYDFGEANSENNFAGAVAFDFLYGFNSQNEETALQAGGISFTQVFDWSDEITVRLGGEYRLLDRRLPLRVGYTFDGITSNPRFPTAFGTPAAPTHIVTLGGGYDAGPWQVNLAYARRMGSATVTDADITAGDQERMAAGRDTCDLCGFPGEYKIVLNGIYLDFSYDFDRIF